MSLSSAPIRTSHVSECPDIGPVCDTRDVPPQVHDQHILLSELRAHAEYGMTPHLALSLVAPFRVVRTSIDFTNLAGEPIVPAEGENLHHRDETVSGVSDPWLLLRWMPAAVGAWSWDVRGGLTLPLGRTEEDPFQSADRGETHQHIQMGTGTVDPVVGAGVRRTGPVALDGWAIARLVVDENSKGYRPGERYSAGFGASRRFGEGRGWWARAGAEYGEETGERWHGVAHLEEGNQGRRDVFLDGTVIRELSTGWSLLVSLKAPVMSRTVGGQLDLPAIFQVGLSRNFHLRPHPGPETPRPPVADGDMRDVVIAGEDVPLQPVSGKVTVFDFWADWCLPCRDLDRRLAGLAGAHPGLAVRRVNIVDWESPIARRHLASVTAIPFVRVHGPDGAVLFDQSGDPEAIEEAVRKALELLGLR